ncbi:hypothetical protein [Zoogloea sp.]|uniref:hypothetical protein n=1 Tax=Zoogloea sp. TaxID=49181 RepID=UPI00321FA10F
MQAIDAHKKHIKIIGLFSYFSVRAEMPGWGCIEMSQARKKTGLLLAEWRRQQHG